jgi:hypothetical protein
MGAELLTVAAAARLAGVPRSTLQSAIARGDLPATRISAALPPLVTLLDVQTWQRYGNHTTGRVPSKQRPLPPLPKPPAGAESGTATASGPSPPQ